MELRVYCMEHLHDSTENFKSSLKWQDVKQKKKTYYTTFKIFVWYVMITDIWHIQKCIHKNHVYPYNLRNCDQKNRSTFSFHD